MAVSDEHDEIIRGSICTVVRIHVLLFASEHEYNFCFPASSVGITDLFLLSGTFKSPKPSLNCLVFSLCLCFPHFESVVRFLDIRNGTWTCHDLNTRDWMNLSSELAHVGSFEWVRLIAHEKVKEKQLACITQNYIIRWHYRQVRRCLLDASASICRGSSPDCFNLLAVSRSLFWGLQGGMDRPWRVFGIVFHCGCLLHIHLFLGFRSLNWVLSYSLAYTHTHTHT